MPAFAGMTKKPKPLPMTDDESPGLGLDLPEEPPKPVKGKAKATTMFDDGACIIYHAAGLSGNGMIEAAAEQDKIAIGVDSDQYQAFVSGQSLGLTRREFELLHLLAEARGQVIERGEIYQKVWGYAMAHGDRSVDVFVRKLRQKLQRHSGSWIYIHTHFGIGYRFDPEPASGEDAAVPERDRSAANKAVTAAETPATSA